MTTEYVKSLPREQGWLPQALSALKHCIAIKLSIMASWFSGSAQGATAKSDLSVSATVVSQCTVSAAMAPGGQSRHMEELANSDCSQGTVATLTVSQDTLPLETRPDTILPAAGLPDRRRFGQVVTVTY